MDQEPENKGESQNMKEYSTTAIYYLYKQCVEIPNSKDPKDIFFRAVVQVQERRRQ